MRYDQALERCIFRFVSGSHAYGTSTPESDEDVRGVFIAPLESAFSLFQTSFVGNGSLRDNLNRAMQHAESSDLVATIKDLEQALQTDQGDLNLSVGTVKNPVGDEELQELRKFLKLAADNNPNILEFLYVDWLVLHTSPIWESIRAKRHLFLSKKAKWTFSGYAYSQISRIRMHRGYLLNPVPKPNRKDFGLPIDSKIPKEVQNIVLTIPIEYLAPDAQELMLKEKQYASAMKNWQSYQKWSVERNPKRKEMEAKFGFDLKHSMHLVRLSLMAKEILSTGNLTVYDPERAKLLLEIRNGGWSYEQVESFAEQTEKDLEELYKTSSLRDSPDHKAISNLYTEICEEHYGIKIR
jgi:predicted nucleotidyltransferase